MKNILLIIAIVAVVTVVGCDLQNTTDNPVSVQKYNGEFPSENEGFLGKFSSETLKELASVRSSTAKYHDINTAIEDGYADITVVVQNMGYHYLKEENVDDTFDPRKPAILVYSKNPANGKMRLVAVEYAVPNTEPEPEGFTGNEDVWENNTDFGLWLCHAWVWYNNPDGIFTDFNPRVHVEEGEITYP